MNRSLEVEANKKLHPTQIRVVLMKFEYLYFSIMTLLCMSSCTTTYPVTSKALLDQALNHVAIELKKDGYYLAGSSTDTKNDVRITGQSYSNYSGYGTRLDNNYITSDTYRFADTIGNSMNFTVSYKKLKLNNGLIFVTNLQVKGCETSNVKEYTNLCGSNSPIKRLDNLPHDTSVSLYDANKTYTFIGVLALLAWIPICALLL